MDRNSSQRRGDSFMSSKHLLLTGGTVIKGTDEPAIQNAAVEARNGRIVEVGEETSARDRKEMVEINISGMTVLPGLIDLHAHHVTKFDAIQRLLLAHGVTSVRDAEVTLRRARIFNLKRKIHVPKTSPRIFLTSPFFDSTPKNGCLKMPSGRFLTPPIIIDDEKLAGSEVRRARKTGINLIEVNFNIDEKVMKAIVSSANEMGIPVVGDLMFSRRVFASHAVNAGLRALDHAGGIAQLFCSNLDKVGFFEEWEYADQKKALAFADSLARSSMFLIPTLVWFEMQSKLAEQSVSDVPLSGLLPEQIRRGWMKPNPLFGMEKWMKGAKASLEKLEEFLGVFAKSGGRVATGTDSPLYFVLPGASIHREIELLANSKLTPIQAIQAATKNPAELLNATDIGTIERGKFADLLIVEGDPLKDIRAIRNVKIIIKNGEIHYPEQLLKST